MRIAQLALTLPLVLVAAPVAAQTPDTATAELRDTDGRTAGHVVLRETAGQGVILDVRLTNAPAGPHGFHIHETGACEPDFGAAGGHYNPHNTSHGVMHPDGHHGGDLMNIHVPDSGELRFEQLAAHVTLGDGAGTLFDADGSAIVLHAGADDYRSQPSGNAGDRLLCGVVTK